MYKTLTNTHSESSVSSEKSISTNTSDEDNFKCRICYEKVNDPIKYCECDGSIGHIHFKCLKKWICENNYSESCEICKFNYKLKFTKTNFNKNNLGVLIFTLILTFFLTIILWYIIITKVLKENNQYIVGGVLMQLFIIGQGIKFFNKNKIKKIKIEYIGDSEEIHLI